LKRCLFSHCLEQIAKNTWYWGN